MKAAVSFRWTDVKLYKRRCLESETVKSFPECLTWTVLGYPRCCAIFGEQRWLLCDIDQWSGRWSKTLHVVFAAIRLADLPEFRPIIETLHTDYDQKKNTGKQVLSSERNTPEERSKTGSCWQTITSETLERNFYATWIIKNRLLFGKKDWK